MYAVYQALAHLALTEFGHIVSDAVFVGGSPASPNKLRLRLADSTFLDIWLSADGDYAYHWEQRAQRGRLDRWDNAPHHAHLATFPEHLHQGSDEEVTDRPSAHTPSARQIVRGGHARVTASSPERSLCREVEWPFFCLAS